MRTSCRRKALGLASVLAGCAAPVPSPVAERDPFDSYRSESAEPAGGERTAVLVSDVDTPAYKSKEAPDAFALVVGVEKYSALPDAQYAERDAAAVREHLLALGYPPRNIAYLSGKEAGRAAIEKYVESWLPRNVDERSRVFVYFSGHGAPGVAEGQAYLVPWDGDPQFLENTGYPLQRLYRNLNALKAREVIVAMDSCFSGAGGRSVLAKGARPLVTRLDMSLPATGKLVVFAASAADEITGAEEAQGHGLFTYHFLKAINERKGDVTVRQVYDYLKPRVGDAARRANRDQTPQLLPADLGARARTSLR